MDFNIPGLGALGGIQNLITDINFPASKHDIVDKARNAGASDKIVSVLDKLPDKVYDSQDDLQKAVEKVI